ncbi:MAG: hypothetical protein ACPGVU_12560 [Limisphaerales bacterium]
MNGFRTHPSQQTIATQLANNVRPDREIQTFLVAVSAPIKAAGEVSIPRQHLRPSQWSNQEINPATSAALMHSNLNPCEDPGIINTIENVKAANRKDRKPPTNSSNAITARCADGARNVFGCSLTDLRSSLIRGVWFVMKGAVLPLMVFVELSRGDSTSAPHLGDAILYLASGSCSVRLGLRNLRDPDLHDLRLRSAAFGLPGL